MKVNPITLLLFASLIWSVAGLNILLIGLTSYTHYWSVLNLLLSLLVFAAFQTFIFRKLVQKHTLRILGYKEQKQFFLKFFDVKGFCIMAIMISAGIILRSGGLVSQHFIAVFYTGLGASLLLAGLLFGYNWGKAMASFPPFHTTQ